MISVFSDLVRTPSVVAVRTFRSDVSRRQPKGGGDRGEKKSRREKRKEREGARGAGIRKEGEDRMRRSESRRMSEREGKDGTCERERGDSRAIGCSTQSSSVCQPVIYGRSS